MLLPLLLMLPMLPMIPLFRYNTDNRAITITESIEIKMLRMTTGERLPVETPNDFTCNISRSLLATEKKNTKASSSVLID